MTCQVDQSSLFAGMNVKNRYSINLLIFFKQFYFSRIPDQLTTSFIEDTSVWTLQYWHSCCCRSSNVIALWCWMLRDVVENAWSMSMWVCPIDRKLTLVDLNTLYRVSSSVYPKTYRLLFSHQTFSSFTYSTSGRRVLLHMSYQTPCRLYKIWFGHVTCS